MLGLKYDDEGDYLRRLPTGHAFILMRRLAFPNPFLVEFPPMKIVKGEVTDEKIKELMQMKVLEEVKKIRETQQVKVETTEKKVEIKLEEIGELDWKIIEVLGNATASSTSEVYNLLNMSGNAFKKHADELLKMGLIGFSVGKVYRQKAMYYFLTNEGEKMFESKFQRQVENDIIDITRLKNFLVNYFTLKTCRWVEERAEQVVFDRSGRKLIASVEFELNKEKLNGKIENLIKEGDLYLACNNEKIKNFVIQQTAKYCLEKKSSNLVVFVATIREMEEGKDFKRIEFQSGPC
jgi:DNA-binding MarR family transcriptional regulator